MSQTILSGQPLIKYNMFLSQKQTFPFILAVLCVLVSEGCLCVSVDLDNDGHICDIELHELLKNAGHTIPGYKMREIIKELDRNEDNKISFQEFLSVSSAQHVSVL